VFLTDAELRGILAHHPLVTPLREDIDPASPANPVQPASLDLTVGAIYVPGTKRGKLGGVGNPRSSLPLGPGRTAVVKTRERCNLPSDIGAIGFPPSSVSAEGLLMTNPGHVDPGYRGVLSFTVINMGHESFQLDKNAPIVTLLFFRLGRAPDADYAQRSPGNHGDVTEGRLAQLSPDFLDVDERALRAASQAEAKARRWGLGVPIVVAVIAVGGTYIQTERAHKDEIQKLQQDVKVLQVKLEARK
jgi:deoxycytidine triphosphate deaminase